jgi:hypothetical protein
MEILLHRPKPRKEIAVSPLPGTEQVNEITLFGVMYSNSLRLTPRLVLFLNLVTNDLT